MERLGVGQHEHQTSRITIWGIEMPHRLTVMLQVPTLSALFGAIAGAGVVLDEKSLVPVGTIGAVSTIVWWVGRKMQHVDDRLDTLTAQVERNRQERLEGLECPICSEHRRHASNLKMKQ